MPAYIAPVDDYRFVLNEFLRIPQYAGTIPGFEEVSADLVDTLAEGAGKFFQEVFAACNREGDERGAALAEDGVVACPGFKAAYEKFVEAGWGSLTFDADFGGQGLPHVLGFMLEEMMSASNLALSLCALLAPGGYSVLRRYGSDELQRQYLPKIVSGEWTVAMSLTEAHAGTDLGLLRTRAEPQADGAYRLTGTKMFITWGDHDMTENIVHLVLARLPDAPGGTQGISLFLVPKYLVNRDGSLGQRNAFGCGSLEEKMGIHGSPTCVINYEGARGFMIGEPNQGMRAMFLMMNAARLSVGLQGVAQAEAACQKASRYVRERLQGRAPAGIKYHEQAADPLIVHPDIRRMLMSMKAFIEGGRAFAIWTGLQIDFAEKHPQPERRAASENLVALLTPVVKAYLTDKGFECVNLALQCFGGHGYVRETGMEQLLRDARITQIYEGANAVQAMDLLGRKVLRDEGRALNAYLGSIAGFLDEQAETGYRQGHAERLAEGVDMLEALTAQLLSRAQAAPDELGAAAMDYLHLVGLVSLGFMWVMIGRVARERIDAGAGNSPFLENKLKTADFFFDRIMPEMYTLKEKILAGSASTMAIADDHL